MMKYVVTLITNDSYSVVYEFYSGGEAWDFIKGALWHAKEELTICVKLIKGNGDIWTTGKEGE